MTSAEEIVARAFLGEKFDKLSNDDRDRALRSASQAIEAYQAHRNDGFFRHHELTVDIAARNVLFRGEPLKLSKINFGLITFLMSRLGQTVPAVEIMRHVWGIAYQENYHYLRVAISELRKIIPGYIQTCPMGYYIYYDAEMIGKRANARRWDGHTPS